jgi:hypothetical protein
LKEELGIKKSKRLTTPHPSAFLLFPFGRTGFPLASAVARSATAAQGPTAQVLKLAAERGINTIPAILQVPLHSQQRWGIEHEITRIDLTPNNRRSGQNGEVLSAGMQTECRR